MPESSAKKKKLITSFRKQISHCFNYWWFILLVFFPNRSYHNAYTPLRVQAVNLIGIPPVGNTLPVDQGRNSIEQKADWCEKAKPTNSRAFCFAKKKKKKKKRRQIKKLKFNFFFCKKKKKKKMETKNKIQIYLFLPILSHWQSLSEMD